VRPIYNIQYLLHRRITMEEPHKGINPVQCTNCQEYGHTKAYCTLKSVCVVCSEPHTTTNCPKNKDKSVEKCRGCGLPRIEEPTKQTYCHSTYIQQSQFLLSATDVLTSLSCPKKYSWNFLR